MALGKKYTAEHIQIEAPRGGGACLRGTIQELADKKSGVAVRTLIRSRKPSPFEDRDGLRMDQASV